VPSCLDSSSVSMSSVEAGQTKRTSRKLSLVRKVVLVELLRLLLGLLVVDRVGASWRVFLSALFLPLDAVRAPGAARAVA